MNDIEDFNYPAPKQEYKVLVRCFTYNQSKYIEDTLKGFADQQTSFPFVCLVMDDASTDGEQMVIKEWIEQECDMSKAEIITIATSDVIIVPHKINTSCTFAFYLLKQNLHKVQSEKIRHVTPWREKSKYEAICEGDDYWIDPLKLQKQVNIMDANPKYTFCHTGFKIFEDSKNEFVDCSDLIQKNTKSYVDKEKIMEDILLGNQYRIQTMTTMIRLSILPQILSILEPYEGKFLMGDTQLWLALLFLGDIGFIPEVTSVYRVNIGSACRQLGIKNKIRFDLSCAEMRVEMARLFNLSKELEKLLQKQYQKKLNLYYCYDKDYKAFVELRFSSIIEKIQFYTFKAKIIRPVLKWFYENIHID